MIKSDEFHRRYGPDANQAMFDIPDSLYQRFPELRQGVGTAKDPAYLVGFREKRFRFRDKRSGEYSNPKYEISWVVPRLGSWLHEDDGDSQRVDECVSGFTKDEAAWAIRWLSMFTSGEYGRDPWIDDHKVCLDKIRARFPGLEDELKQSRQASSRPVQPDGTNAAAVQAERVDQVKAKV
jgi:hypothetical protein